MRDGTRQLFLASLLAAMFAGMAACRSSWVDTTLVNRGPALHVVELDYPSASFGVDELAAGGQYHYRFKIQGSGPLSLQFEDSSGKSHTVQGPVLSQNQGGSLIVTIDAGNRVSWAPRLTLR